MTKEVDISFSKMNMLFRCGEQFRRRYIEGERFPPGVQAIIGSGTHSSVDINMKHKIDNKKNVDKSVALDTARDYITNSFECEDYILQEEEKSIGKDKIKGQAVDMGIKLSGLHYDEVAPDINPVASEQKWRLDIEDKSLHTTPSGLCVTGVTGIIDIKEKNAYRDTKTAGKSPSEGSIEQSVQLGLYGLASRVLDKKPVQNIHLDHLVKTAKPKYVHETAKITQDKTDVTTARLVKAVEVMESGMFTPTNPDNWWCSKKWCGYHATCPYAMGKKVI